MARKLRFSPFAWLIQINIFRPLSLLIKRWLLFLFVLLKLCVVIRNTDYASEDFIQFKDAPVKFFHVALTAL